MPLIACSLLGWNLKTQQQTKSSWKWIGSQFWFAGSTRANSLHFRQIKSIGIVPKWIHQWLGVSVPQRLMRSARNLWNGRSICMKHWKYDIDMRNLEGITSAANTELHFETWNALVAGRTRSQKLWNTRTSANLYRLTMLKVEPQTLIMYWTKWIIWFLTCDFWGYVRDNLQAWLKRQTREVQESYNQNCKWFSFVNFDLQDNGLSKTLQHCSVGEPTTVYCGSWRLLPKLWMNATNWAGKLFMKSVRAIAPCETCNATSRQVQAKKIGQIVVICFASSPLLSCCRGSNSCIANVGFRKGGIVCRSTVAGGSDEVSRCSLRGSIGGGLKKNNRTFTTKPVSCALTYLMIHDVFLFPPPLFFGCLFHRTSWWCVLAP